MGFIGRAIKGGLAVKAAQVVRGQLQRRASQGSTTTARPGRGRTLKGRPVRAGKR